MRQIFLLVITILVLKLFLPDIADVLETTILDVLQMIQRIIETQSGPY